MSVYGIFFDASVLLNHIFYTQKFQTGGNTKIAKKYKLDNINDINYILYHLYLRSYKSYKQMIKNKKIEKYLRKELQYMGYRILSIFQEIFTKLKLKLNKAMYITLQPDDI
jgi:hypothetical protein